MLRHYKATLSLGLPIAVGQLGIIVTGFADTMMIGLYSTSALAAASFVNSLFNLVNFLLIGYSYGLTPLISRLYGQGRQREIGQTLRNGLVCNLLFAFLVLAIVTVGFFLIDWMGQPREVVPLIRSYYLPVLVSMLFVSLFSTVRQFTDGVTDTAIGMWILLVGNALNILGNYLLIYGIGFFPEWGLFGAGVSTLVSRIFMALALPLGIILKKRYTPYIKGLRGKSVHAKALGQIHTTSLPVSLQMGMETGAFTFCGIMAGWIGAIDLATFQVLMTMGTLGYLLYYSFGASMSIRIASFYGTHNVTELRKASLAGTHILLIMTTLACLAFYFFGEAIIRLFTSDPAVIALGLALIPFLILYQFGDAMQVCFSNALRGMTQVRSVMLTAFVSYIVINIPLGYILAFPCNLGSAGLFLAFSAGLFTAALLYGRAFWGVLRRM